MLLKLTLANTGEPVFVNTEKIIAFRLHEAGDQTQIATTHNKLEIHVQETPEQVAEMWGKTVKKVQNDI